MVGRHDRARVQRCAPGRGGRDRPAAQRETADRQRARGPSSGPSRPDPRQRHHGKQPGNGRRCCRNVEPRRLFDDTATAIARLAGGTRYVHECVVSTRAGTRRDLARRSRPSRLEPGARDRQRTQLAEHVVGSTMSAIVSAIGSEWQVLDTANLQYWRRDIAQLVVIGLVAAVVLVLLVRAAVARKPGRNQVILPAILRRWSPSRLAWTR